MVVWPCASNCSRNRRYRESRRTVLSEIFRIVNYFTIERSDAYGEEPLHTSHGLHPDGQGAVRLGPWGRGDPVGDLGLDEKHDPRGEGWREGLVDQGRGDGVGNVADDLEMRNGECGMRND